MNEPRNQPSGEQPCYFFYLGLLVTGKGERQHLPKLFRALMAAGICTVEVIGFVGQRSPLTSEKKKIKMVGSGKMGASRFCKPGCRGEAFAHKVLGLAVNIYSRMLRPYFSLRNSFYLPLNVEAIRESPLQGLVGMLKPQWWGAAKWEHRDFANPRVGAVGAIAFAHKVLGLAVNIYSRMLRPYGRIKFSGWQSRFIRECFALTLGGCSRTLFAWCSKCLGEAPTDKYRLLDGKLSHITSSQLDDIV